MKNNKRPMINDALRLLRLYMGLSQKELSTELGMSQSMVSEIESGTRSITVEILERYSEQFDVRMSDLMFFAEELTDEPVKKRGKLLFASSTLKLLERLAPREVTDAH